MRRGRKSPRSHPAGRRPTHTLPTRGTIAPLLPQARRGRLLLPPTRQLPANYPPLEDGHGGCIVNDHEMLGGFPHRGLADFQFYRMMANAPSVDLEPLGLGAVQPVIQPLSAYFVCRPLAYLFEVACGQGGIIVCSLELNEDWPEAHYLLHAILHYAAGKRFAPKFRLTEEMLGKLVEAARV